MDKSARIIQGAGQYIRVYLEERPFLLPLQSCVKCVFYLDAELSSSCSYLIIQESKGVTEVYDALEELSEKLQDALTCIELHLNADTKPSSRLKDIFIEMLVQVLQVFGFLIKYPDNKAKKTQNVFWQRSSKY